MSITLEQAAIFMNVLGLMLPVVFSFSIAHTYDRPYFTSWVYSYAAYLAMIIALLTPVQAAYASALTVVQVSLMQAGNWFLLRTTERLSNRSHRRFGAVWWGASVVGLVLAAAGLPLPAAGAATVLLMVAVHLLLAWVLFRLPPREHLRAHYRLAALLVGLALWSLAYPALGSTSFAWLGFAVSGLFHLFIGVEMVVVLLEDTAHTLREQNRELQQLDLLKSQFISTVSHELRTPLNAIRSSVWLLEQGRALKNTDEVVAIISNQSAALQHLVEELLDYSKIEGGHLEYRKAPVGLDKLVQAVVHDMRPQFAQKQVGLELVQPDAPIHLEADASRLTQVLNNLLSNALKFSPGGGEVVVRVRCTNDQARVEVADDGPGIPPEHQARIFERFYQVDNSSTRKVGGAGLGLAIAKAIVEEGHGGKLWVESHPGQGSTFIVSLPA